MVLLANSLLAAGKLAETAVHARVVVACVMGGWDTCPGTAQHMERAAYTCPHVQWKTVN